METERSDSVAELLLKREAVRQVEGGDLFGVTDSNLSSSTFSSWCGAVNSASSDAVLRARAAILSRSIFSSDRCLSRSVRTSTQLHAAFGHAPAVTERASMVREDLSFDDGDLAILLHLGVLKSSCVLRISVNCDGMVGWLTGR